MLRSLTNLARFIIVRDYYQYHGRFNLITFVVIDGFILGWLIYGNILLYSEENLCNKTDDLSRVLYDIMLVLIIIGYFQMLLYAMIIILVPALLIYMHFNPHAFERRDLNDQAIP